tara:strand:+ start:606 stop:986 length:381 start_codon:yes stop_codon:yes gene_type:complete
MGTRLYPDTDNTANLTELINVPEDTFDRLKYIEEQYKDEYPDDWYAHYHDHIEGDGDLSKANHFKLFGWGKFNLLRDPEGNYIEEYGDTNDPEFAYRLFVSANNKELSNHLSVERVLQLSSGLHWC